MNLVVCATCGKSALDGPHGIRMTYRGEAWTDRHHAFDPVPVKVGHPLYDWALEDEGGVR